YGRRDASDELARGLRRRPREPVLVEAASDRVVDPADRRATPRRAPRGGSEPESAPPPEQHDRDHDRADPDEQRPQPHDLHERIAELDRAMLDGRAEVLEQRQL